MNYSKNLKMNLYAVFPYKECPLYPHSLQAAEFYIKESSKSLPNLSSQELLRKGENGRKHVSYRHKTPANLDLL